jgi:hypothetical protein
MVKVSGPALAHPPPADTVRACMSFSQIPSYRVTHSFVLYRTSHHHLPSTMPDLPGLLFHHDNRYGRLYTSIWVTIHPCRLEKSDIALATHFGSIGSNFSATSLMSISTSNVTSLSLLLPFFQRVNLRINNRARATCHDRVASDTSCQKSNWSA